MLFTGRGMTFPQMMRGEWWRNEPIAAEIKSIRTDILKLQVLMYVTYAGLMQARYE